MLETKLGLGEAPTTTTERGRNSGSSRRGRAAPGGTRLASALNAVYIISPTKPPGPGSTAADLREPTTCLLALTSGERHRVPHGSLLGQTIGSPLERAGHFPQG